MQDSAPPEQSQVQAISLERALKLLSEGDIELHGLLPWCSNYTFLITVGDGELKATAVYKPCRGERPLWDFPEGTLAMREVAAYIVSEALGFHFVPCTVLREVVPVYGPGSIQQFVEYDPGHHYFNFSEEDKRRLPPVVLFDLLVNNADRKGSHVLLEEGTHKLWAIDHGLCFHEEEKLRTVLWDSAGQPIPPDLMERLGAVERLTKPGGVLRKNLRDYLTAREITAVANRAEHLLATGVFPLPPDHRRAFPYPPI